MSDPPQRVPPGFTRDQANAIVKKIDSELTPEERDLLSQAGQKMRFWTNVGIFVGFMGFSLPWTMRSQIQMRFVKGMIAGTVGVFVCAPAGMVYGASRAQKLIMTHPNHNHLLKVLQETRSEIMAGRGPGSSTSTTSSSDNPFPETETQSSSPAWPSERQDAFPSTPNSSRDTFDDGTLLSDDEINRQNQGATFDSSRERPQQQPTTDKPRSAWDALRARAQNPQQPPQEQPPKEKNVWGEDK